MSRNSRKAGLVFYIFRRWRGFSIFEARELRSGSFIPLWARGMPSEAKKVETMIFTILAVASEAEQQFKVHCTVPAGVENGPRNLLYPLDKRESAIVRAIIRDNKNCPIA